MFFEVLVKTVLITLIPVLLFLYVYTSWNHDYWKKKKIPYEKPFPIVGNLQFVMRKSVFDVFHDLYQKHPSKYFGMFLGNVPVLVTQTPELAKKILLKDADNFNDRFLYSGYSDPLGALNLFTVKNPIWAEMRRELTTMFTSARLKLVADLMNDNAKELVRRIERQHIDTDEPTNLKELFSMYASDTVGFTVFGLRTSALRNSDSPLWYITSHMVKWKFWRGLEFSLIFLVPALAEKLRLKFFSSAATDYIKQLFYDVVDKRKNNNTFNDNKKDLVNLLLKLKENTKIHGEKMSDELMLAQVAVFILGSIETSSTTLSYLLHELAHHPEEQEKLYREVNNAMKEKNKNILDYNDLMELKYLTSCILETLRKYPPVAYLDRLCRHDYQVDENLTLARGTPVFVNVMALHHNPGIYPDPKKWRPSRFTGEQETDNRNFTFLPFGEGPRFCIGKRFGVVQVRVATAQIISNYRLAKVPGPYDVPTDPYSVILSPKGGLSVKFIPRN